MIWVIPKMDLLENGIYICGKHPLLLTNIQASDPGPMGPFFVFKIIFFFFKFLKPYHQSVKQFGPRASQNVGPDLDPNCFQRLSAKHWQIKSFKANRFAHM